MGKRTMIQARYHMEEDCTAWAKDETISWQGQLLLVVPLSRHFFCLALKLTLHWSPYLTSVLTSYLHAPISTPLGVVLMSTSLPNVKWNLSWLLPPYPNTKYYYIGVITTLARSNSFLCLQRSMKSLNLYFTNFTILLPSPFQFPWHSFMYRNEPSYLCTLAVNVY